MMIETPLHAEHQLDQLARQFEHWRQTRTHPRERFPQALWDQSVALAAPLPPAHVAKQLRLHLIDLKKQMATAHARGCAVLPIVPPVPLPLCPMTIRWGAGRERWGQTAGRTRRRGCWVPPHQPICCIRVRMRALAAS